MRDRLDHTRCRFGAVRAVETELSDLVAVPAVHEVFLERDPAIVETHHGAEGVVGCRDHLGADTKGSGDRAGHRGEGGGSCDLSGPVELEREITVAQAKGVVDTEARELVVEGERVVATAPSERSLDSGERVHHGVEVGAHHETMVLGVVSHVDDDRQLDPIESRQPPGKPGATHASGELDDPQFGPSILLSVSHLFTMAVRMSQTTPQVADTESVDEVAAAPRVRVIVTAVAGADLDAALAVVGRQVYEPTPEVVLVGGEVDGVLSVATLEDAITTTDSSFDYLWLLHADARPRPDALAALITEIERNDAALAGSKLLKAGTMDELESVGGATDVFGEPYSGLDEGEIDLQQYDVVREVAFVQSASMLVRRDLAQGLKGLDPLLPPIAAGLDFSQRTRLSGGRV